MNTQPSSADPASRLYQGASGRDYHEGKRSLNPEALRWVTALRARKFQPHVASDATVLELGVGAGWNLADLRCGRRIGCDASEWVRESITRLGIEYVDVLSAVPGACADVALCHHALEHLLEPAESLRQLARILKPGGKLILHVPWERERRYAHYDPAEPNHHLYHWNAQNLGNLAVVLGYSLNRVLVRRYGYDRFAANLAASCRLGRGGFLCIRSLLIGLRPLYEVELIATR